MQASVYPVIYDTNAMTHTSHGDYVEQLTYLLFLKMDYERTRPPYNRKSTIPDDTCAVFEGLDQHYVCQSVALARPVLTVMSKYLMYWLLAPRAGAAYFKKCLYGQGLPALNASLAWYTLPPQAPTSAYRTPRRRFRVAQGFCRTKAAQSRDHRGSES